MTGNLTVPTVIGNLQGNAATATNVAWSGVTGKPSTFTPSTHTHSISQVTWNASENLVCNGDNSEWSIDMNSNAPNSYFHIWSGYLGNSCMKFENKTIIITDSCYIIKEYKEFMPNWFEWDGLEEVSPYTPFIAYTKEQLIS